MQWPPCRVRGPASLVLYDVSTLYSETDGADGFREPVFSKERRPGPPGTQTITAADPLPRDGGTVGLALNITAALRNIWLPWYACVMSVDDDLAAWIAGLDDLFALVASRFFRVEPRLRARAYVRGLLAPLAAKNGWTLAEAAGDATPDGMQRLLNRAAWDADGSATTCAPISPGTSARRTACWWWTRPGS